MKTITDLGGSTIGVESVTWEEWDLSANSNKPPPDRFGVRVTVNGCSRVTLTVEQAERLCDEIRWEAANARLARRGAEK